MNDILNRWRKGVDAENSDPLTYYESVRELAKYCKEENIRIPDLHGAVRLRNYLARLGLDLRDKEDAIENFIASLAMQPEPAKLIEVAGQIAGSGLSLELSLEPYFVGFC